MKKFITALCIAGSLATGCDSRTEYGECVGVNDEKDPTLVYRTSKWNVTMGILFLSTIVAPVLVVFCELACPVAKKKETVSK